MYVEYNDELTWYAAGDYHFVDCGAWEKAANFITEMPELRKFDFSFNDTEENIMQEHYWRDTNVKKCLGPLMQAIEKSYVTTIKYQLLPHSCPEGIELNISEWSRTLHQNRTSTRCLHITPSANSTILSVQFSQDFQTSLSILPFFTELFLKGGVETDQQQMIDLVLTKAYVEVLSLDVLATYNLEEFCSGIAQCLSNTNGLYDLILNVQRGLELYECYTLVDALNKHNKEVRTRLWVSLTDTSVVNFATALKNLDAVYKWKSIEVKVIDSDNLSPLTLEQWEEKCPGVRNEACDKFHQVICDISSYDNLVLSNHELIIDVTDHEGGNMNNEKLEDANLLNKKYNRWEKTDRACLRASFLHKFLRVYIKQQFASDDFKNFPLQSECHNDGVICALATIQKKKYAPSQGVQSLGLNRGMISLRT
jgi:hypothetical protein